MRVDLRFPAYLVSEANKKDHRQVAATRTRKLRADLRLFLNTKRLPPLPVTVRLVRWSPDPQTLDQDNLARAFKAVQDEVAHKLDINDADPRVSWHYAQGRGPRHEAGIVVQERTWQVTETPTATVVRVPAALAPQGLAPGSYDLGGLTLIIE